MATWQDLYALLGEDLDAVEIRRRLKVTPYRLNQLLRCKHLNEQGTVVAELAGVMARHRAVGDVQRAISRLGELIFDGSTALTASPAAGPETVREACMTLLALAGTVVCNTGVPPVEEEEEEEEKEEEKHGQDAHDTHGRDARDTQDTPGQEHIAESVVTPPAGGETGDFHCRTLPEVELEQFNVVWR